MPITGPLGITVRHKGATTLRVERETDDTLWIGVADDETEEAVALIDGAPLAKSKRHALKIAHAILALYTGRRVAVR